MTHAQLGKPNAIATDISGHGRIVGFREIVVNGQLRAVAVTRLGQAVDTLPSPKPEQRVRTRASGVNLCGAVAGTVESLASGVMQAVLWTRSSCDT